MGEARSGFVDQLHRRRNELWSDIEKNKGYRDGLIQQKSQSIQAIDASQAYLDQKEAVHAVLSQMHERSVEEVKRLYEDLLTSILRDIFTNDPENDHVRLNLSIKRNQAALSIEVINREGLPRDVFLDKGGSVRSIIAIGLRFIALARSPRRRLVVLDEADRELNPRYIPRFARMIEQLSSRIGMQVIYVSHHDQKFFEGHARIIELHRDKGSVTADCVSDKGGKTISGWEGEQDIGDWMEGAGLTDLRLFNVKQHRNTLIELSPTVNVVSGDSDVGKSTIIQAIEMVARNNPRQGMIRDHERELRVEIGLEGSHRLVFRYRRQGDRKTCYRIFNHDNVKTQESRDGVKEPDWLHTYLGMATYQGFDLHIGMQASINFVLDSRYSDHKRAEILSLSRIAGDAQRLISLHNRHVETHRRNAHQARNQLRQVKERLSMIAPMAEVELELKAIDQMVTNITHIDQQIRDIHVLGRQIRQLTLTQGVLSQVSDLSDLDEVPDFGNLERLQQDIAVISALEKQCNALSVLLDVEDLPQPPDKEPLEAIVAMGREWSMLHEQQRALKQIPNAELNDDPLPDPAHEHRELTQLMGQMKQLQDSANQVGEKIKQADESVKSLDGELDRALQDLGDFCPTCYQPLGDHVHYEKESCHVQ